MREREPGLLAILLLAFLGVFSVRSIPHKPSSQTSSPSPTEQSQADEEQRSDQGTPTEPKCTAESILQEQSACESKLGNCHWMVVTVPDPSDPSSTDTFDLTIDSIQRAMAACGFLQLRHSFAWIPTKRSQQPPTVRFRDGASGCLVFRQSNPDLATQPHHYVVLLASESPTAGVNAQRLEACLNTIHEHSRCDGNGNRPDRIRILGPRYSGSAGPLAATLYSWNAGCEDHAYDYDIVSGTATAITEPFTHALGTRTCFSSTVHHDEEKYLAIQGFLARYSRGTIALLCESDTGFGKRSMEILSKGRSDSRKQKDPGAALKVEVIPYPLHISCARSALEQRGSSGVYLDLFPDYRHRLEIPMAEPARSQDKLSPFSPEMAAVNFEMVESDLLAAMSHKDADWVGIIGTDIRDIIFLAKLAHLNAPDVRMFFLESNALLAHPGLKGILDGSLVFGSYPLSLIHRSPSEGALAWSVFASQAHQGVYNAALALMAKEANDRPWTGGLIDQQVVKHTLDFEHTTDVHGDKHEVWVSLIGTGRLWPLSPLPTAASKTQEDRGGEYLYQKPVSKEPGNSQTSPPERLPMPTWLILLTLFALLTVRTVSFPGRSNVARSKKWPAALGPLCPAPPFSPRMTLLASGQIVVLLSVLTVFVLMAASGAFTHAILLRGVFAVCLIVPVTVAGVEMLSRTEDDSSRLGDWLAAGMLGLLVFWSGVILLAAPIPDLDHHARRALALTGGVSPALTALLLGLALYMWLFFEIKHLRLTSRFNPDGSHLPETQFHTVKQVLEQARAIVNISADQRRSLVLPLAIVVALVLIFYNRIGSTVEGRLADEITWLAMLIIVFLVVWTLVRFYMLWRTVKRVLRLLAWSPVVNTFDYVPQKVGQSIGPYFFGKSFRQAHATIFISHVSHLLGERSEELEELESQYADNLENESKTGQIPEHAMEKWFQAASQQWTANQNQCFQQPCGDPPNEKQRQEQEHKSNFEPKEHCERSLAIYLVWMIAFWFYHLRCLMLSMTIGALLLVITIDSYPFYPHRLLMLVPWLLVLSVALVTLTVFIQIDRDETVSRILRTTPNRLSFDRNFLTAVGAFVLPLLAVVASQFPEVSGLFGKWLGPVLRSMG